MIRTFFGLAPSYDEQNGRVRPGVDSRNSRIGCPVDIAKPVEHAVVWLIIGGKMKRLVSLFALTAVLATPLAYGQQSSAAGNAVAAANHWLTLSDANDGASTWDQAAPSFQAAISRAGWSDALKQARQPFGAVKSRKLVSSEVRHSLPGAPDGQYVVIQYDTQFEHKEHAVETVVPMLDQDGKWKVSGYFVK